MVAVKGDREWEKRSVKERKIGGYGNKNGWTGNTMMERSGESRAIGIPRSFSFLKQKSQTKLTKSAGSKGPQEDAQDDFESVEALIRSKAHTSQNILSRLKGSSIISRNKRAKEPQDRRSSLFNEKTRAKAILSTLFSPEFGSTNEVLEIVCQSQKEAKSWWSVGRKPKKKHLLPSQVIVARVDGVFIFTDPAHVEPASASKAAKLPQIGFGYSVVSSPATEGLIRVGSAFFWGDAHFTAGSVQDQVVVRGNARALWWSPDLKRLSTDRQPVVAREDFFPENGAHDFIETFSIIQDEQVALGYRPERLKQSRKKRHENEDDFWNLSVSDDEDEETQGQNFAYAPVGSGSSSNSMTSDRTGSSATLISDKSSKSISLFVTRKGRSMATAVEIDLALSWNQFCGVVDEVLKISNSKERPMSISSGSGRVACTSMETVFANPDQILIVN